MKKLFITLTLSCIIGAAFAQKTFKQLDFHKAGSTIIRQNGMLSDLVSTLAGPKNGTIIINTRDLTLTINAEGENAKVYKINTIQQETSDQYDHKRLPILCTDADGISCTAIIEREYAFKTSNEMILRMTYTNGTGKRYFCTYLENLFEN